MRAFRFELEEVIESDIYKNIGFYYIIEDYFSSFYYERTNSFGQRSSLFMFAAHEMSNENI